MTKECARCTDKKCYEGADCFDLRSEVMARYSPDDVKSMQVSGEIEATFYMQKTRLEEIMLYARDMGFRKLGIAFCVGLSQEASVLDKILAKEGFEVHSACCKICGIDKGRLGVRKMGASSDDEAVCNPVGQAMRLEDCGTEMNIIVGLCVGHDMLFTKHSKAPVTTFIVKDRVLSHNPVGAIYSSYYLENRFGITPPL